MNANRNKSILAHIVCYCDQISEAVDIFGNEHSIFYPIIPIGMPAACACYRSVNWLALFQTALLPRIQIFHGSR